MLSTKIHSRDKFSELNTIMNTRLHSNNTTSIMFKPWKNANQVGWVVEDDDDDDDDSDDLFLYLSPIPLRKAQNSQKN